MLPYCPKCGKCSKVSAIHHKERVVMCLRCGQGWKGRINGSVSYTKGILFELDAVLNKMIVQIGKRRVRLQAVPVRMPTTMQARN
jgi:hypothetical protein